MPNSEKFESSSEAEAIEAMKEKDTEEEAMEKAEREREEI